MEESVRKILSKYLSFTVEKQMYERWFSMRENPEVHEALIMKTVLALLLLVGMSFAISQASAEETMYIVGYPDTFLRGDPSTENPYASFQYQHVHN